jgi:ornithine carbamoyltransferase
MMDFGEIDVRKNVNAALASAAVVFPDTWLSQLSAAIVAVS